MCCAVSAFDKVVAVLQRDSDVVGTDSTVSPLAHDELGAMLAHPDFTPMQELIRGRFTSGSGEALSERDVRSLAMKATIRLGGRGAFLLQPYTPQFIQSHRRMVS